MYLAASGREFDHGKHEYLMLMPYEMRWFAKLPADPFGPVVSGPGPFSG